MTINRVNLSEMDRDHLVHAVESATKIHRQGDFRTWIRREFHALLPHESMVCVEIDDSGDAHLVECLDHKKADSDCADLYLSLVFGLSLGLLRSLPPKSPLSCLMDAGAITALRDERSQSTENGNWEIRNALIHRIEFLSGARYYLVLFNTPPDQAPRSQHLLKLLSSHLKMSLSWNISQRERIKQTPLTIRELEILQQIREGKSNREISEHLGINPLTLKTHIAKIYRKLNVQTRAAAASHHC